MIPVPECPFSPYGVFASFADQFETIWATATPVGNPLSLAIQPEV